MSQRLYPYPSWVVPLACGAVVMSLATGTRQVSGLFLQPVALDLGMGLDGFGTVVAAQNLVWGLAQPLAGALADRHGARPVALACGLLYAAGLGLAATAGGATAFALGLALLCGLGQAGTAYAVVLAVIGRAAPADRRGLAVGLAASAGSVGMFVLVPATSLLIDGLGWREAMGALALLMLAAPLLALGLGGQPDPAPRGAAPPGRVLREAAGDRDFWLLNLGFATCGLQLAFLATYLPTILVERGLAPSAGAAALAAIGLLNIAGTYAAGLAGDRWPRGRVLVALYLARAVAMLAFLAAPPGPAAAIAFGAAIGLLFGLVYVGHQLGAFLGVWAGGWVRERTGGFDAAWALVIGLSFLAALCHALLRETPRAAALAEGAA